MDNNFATWSSTLNNFVSPYCGVVAGFFGINFILFDIDKVSYLFLEEGPLRITTYQVPQKFLEGRATKNIDISAFRDIS